MNILVTGAKGMVGTALVNNLKNIRDGKNRTRNIRINEIYEYDLNNTEDELDEYCAKADFVFNLAGVNRPENPEDFMKGNFGFASQLLDTLKKHNNKAGIMLSSSSAIYKGVVAGEYVVGVSYEDPCVSLLVDGATNVKLVYPEEGAVWLPAGTAIIKNAPNMENAKLFIDWIISDEGQAEIAKTTARPVNPNIANTAKEMTPFADITVKYEDMELCGTNKKDWQARWTELFNAAQ